MVSKRGAECDDLEERELALARFKALVLPAGIYLEECASGKNCSVKKSRLFFGSADCLEHARRGSIKVCSKRILPSKGARAGGWPSGCVAF